MNFSDSWLGLIQILPIEGWLSSSLFSDIQFADIAASCGALATREKFLQGTQVNPSASLWS